MPLWGKAAQKLIPNVYKDKSEGRGRGGVYLTINEI